MMAGASVVMINVAHKSFHITVHWVTRHTNQMTYSLCFPIRYYNSSEIEFYTCTVMKI